MAEDTAAIAASLSAATTGPSTPDHLTVGRPSRESVWTLILTQSIVCVLALIMVYILGWGAWSATDSVALARIHYLGLGLLLAIGAVWVVVIALASSRLGRVDASAGSNHIAIEGRDDAPSV